MKERIKSITMLALLVLLMLMLFAVFTNKGFSQYADGKTYRYTIKTFPDSTITLPLGSIIVGRNAVYPHKVKVYYFEPLPTKLDISSRTNFVKKVTLWYGTKFPTDTVATYRGHTYNVDSLGRVDMEFADSTHMIFWGGEKSHEEWIKIFR